MRHHAEGVKKPWGKEYGIFFFYLYLGNNQLIRNVERMYLTSAYRNSSHKRLSILRLFKNILHCWFFFPQIYCFKSSHKSFISVKYTFYCFPMA